jgi:hypothetical protein
MSKEELLNIGCYSKFDLIESYSNHLWPLLAAFFYVIAFPVIHSWIKAWSIKMSSQGETWGMNWSKEKGKIPVMKYYNLKTGLEKQMKIVEEVLASENHYQNENIQLKEDVVKQMQTVSNLTTQLSDLQKKSKVSFLKGIWELIYIESSENKSIEFMVNDNGEFAIKTSENFYSQSGYLNNYSYNILTNTMQFWLDKTTKIHPVAHIDNIVGSFFCFEYNEGANIYYGTFDSSKKVHLKKISR